MLIVKKLLSPIFTGVLVAFLFIAVETAFLPPSVSKPKVSPSQIPVVSTSASIDQGLKKENTKEAIQNSKSRIQNYNDQRLTPGIPAQKSDKNFKVIQNYQKPSQNSQFKIQNDKKPAQSFKRQNRLTDNVNVLFIGVDKGKLLACSVFTINYQDKYQAGAVFVPTYSKAPKYKYTFGEIYEKVGVEGLRRVLEKEMEVDISLYYSIERELLKQLETYIDPIYIDDRKVELYNLFTMAVSPQDEQILGALTRELLKPGVFFTKLPRLLLDATKYIKTDFKVTFQNLKFHYNNIVNLDTHNIKKVVLPVSQKMSGSKTYYEVDEYALKNGIYEISR